MAWIPISGTLPQYSTSANALADDYYLKFYQSGTTTPINMATDSTGGTTLAKCALSADGYPISNPLDDDTKFIPHIDQNYRIVLYANETDADNDTTANAAFNIDGMVPQIAPTADAEDITLRSVSIQTQDDYDRSPLFVDGTDFTAGAGPHTITTPAGWNPTNSDVRFYKVASNGVVTSLTPTGTTSSSFTIAETLLSTDTLFIGDDTFRNQFDGDLVARADILRASDNLSDLPSASTARTNLGIEPSAISGWNVSRFYYIKDVSNVFNNAFDATSITVNTWESVGPTGSGATNIWTNLDDLIGSGASYLDLRIKITGNNPAGSASGLANFRKTGDTTTTTSTCQRSFISVNVTGSGASNTIISGETSIRIPVDSLVRFDLHYPTQSGTPTIEIGIVGAGV